MCVCVCVLSLQKKPVKIHISLFGLKK